MTTLPPYQPPPPHRESRPILFWLAIGCGGALVLLVAFIAVIFGIVTAAMRGSTPVRETIAQARANPEIVAAIGTPVRTGYSFTGNISTNNDSGSADVAFSLRGPKGKADAHVVAKRIRKRWYYTRMMVALKDGREIDLRPNEPLPAED